MKRSTCYGLVGAGFGLGGSSAAGYPAWQIALVTLAWSATAALIGHLVEQT